MFDNVLEFQKLTRTAQEAADQIGCNIGQIVKSLIFKNGQNKPILVVASGSNRVDEQKFGLLKADADYVREITGFVIGGVPPWGHKQKIKTIIDKDLKQYDKIWAAAGKNNAVFPLTFDELVEKTEGQISEISQHDF